MSGVVLAASTGDENVDALLREVISRVEQALPTRIRGYYVVGSHADGSALPLSDIDLDIVVKDGLDDDAIQDVEIVALDIVNSYAASRAANLGAFFMHEACMQGIGNPAFKLASLFLYGQDTRDDLPLISSEEWARQLMHSIYLVTGRERGLSALTYPLDYPDPHGEFYGYDHNTKPQPDGTTTRGTRGLVTGAGWYATGMIALGTGRYVLRSDDELAVGQTLRSLQHLPYKDEDIQIALQDIDIHP